MLLLDWRLQASPARASGSCHHRRSARASSREDFNAFDASSSYSRVAYVPGILVHSTSDIFWYLFFRRLYLHDQRPSAPCEIRSATTRTHGVSSSSLDAPELLIERPRDDIRDRTTVANADAYARYATKRHEIVMTCQIYEILFIFLNSSG